MSDHVEAPCPHTKCRADINVPLHLPNGTYKCKCHAARLRLSWITDVDRGRYPSLSMEPGGAL